jgi:hypothetical protein
MKRVELDASGRDWWTGREDEKGMIDGCLELTDLQTTFVGLRPGSVGLLFSGWRQKKLVKTYSVEGA